MAARAVAAVPEDHHAPRAVGPNSRCLLVVLCKNDVCRLTSLLVFPVCAL